MDAWIPLVGAAVGAMFVVLNTLVSRSTARDIALLTAQQKRRDIDIAVINNYGAALLRALDAVQHYVWYSPTEILEKGAVSTDAFEKAQPIVERTTATLSELEYLGDSLPTGDAWSALTTSHAEISALFAAITQLPDDDEIEPANARDLWNEAVGTQPTPFNRAVREVNELKRKLLDEYPVDVPNSLRSRWRRMLGREKSA